MLRQFARRGLSISQVAKDTGVDRTTLGRWLDGSRHLTSDNASAVLEYVGLHLIAFEDLPYALPVMPPVRPR